MSSTVSLTTLSELSDELNKRISELELLSYQSERILLLLNLCELENDPECEQNNDEFQINVQPEELALDRDNNSPKFAGRVESAVSPTTTSLEDVLSMARAIRSKGAGQIIVPQSIVNEKSNTALERKQVR